MTPRRMLLIVCLGCAMVVVDTTAVNVGLPSVRADLGGGTGSLQWVIDAYVLVFAGLLILGGSLGDVLGSGRVFRAGVLMFTSASAGCALAPSLEVLVVARVAQGVGASLLAPACLALIANAFPDAAARARAVAVFVTAAGSPQAFGPLLGGTLIGVGGWRSIFWVNVPLGVVTVALTLGRPLPRGRDVRRVPIAWWGHLGVLVVAGALTTVIIEAPRTGVFAAPVLAAASALVVGGALLLRHQRLSPHPALPSALLRAPSVLQYTALGSLLFAAYYGLSFVLTLHLQQREGLSALATGAAFLASALPIFALPLLTNSLVVRVGASRVLRAGLAVAALGAALLALGAVGHPVVREFALLLLGTGVGLSVGPQITLVLDRAPDEVVARASGLLNAARQLGTVLGVAVLGAVAAGSSEDGVMVAAALAATGLLIAAGPGLGRTTTGTREPEHAASPG